MFNTFTYSISGMLEAFVSCLKSYAKHLKSDQEDASHVKDPEHQKFGKKEFPVFMQVVESVENLVRNLYWMISDLSNNVKWLQSTEKTELVFFLLKCLTWSFFLFQANLSCPFWRIWSPAIVRMRQFSEILRFLSFYLYFPQFCFYLSIVLVSQHLLFVGNCQGSSVKLFYLTRL